MDFLDNMPKRCFRRETKGDKIQRVLISAALIRWGKFSAIRPFSKKYIPGDSGPRCQGGERSAGNLPGTLITTVLTVYTNFPRVRLRGMYVVCTRSDSANYAGCTRSDSATFCT
jgi:hypothetical protein